MYRSRARFKSNKTSKDVMAFEGMNNTENHKESNIYDMKNLSSDKFPFIAPRPPRSEFGTLTDGKYLFGSDKLCWVDGLTFYYDAVSKGTLTSDPTCIVEMNDFIVIFPDEVYFDKVNDLWGSFSSGYNIEHATVNDNRMFAVDGNQLIASKQGDFKTWNSFQGISTDSYAVDVATQGDFIGITTYQDHVTAFKEYYMHELYGNMPSNYTIPEALKKGCIDYKSISELDGVLVFMSQDGIYEYAGGLPRKISDPIDINFAGGVATSFNNKYYVSLFNGTSHQLLVYSGRYKEFYKEDDLQVTHFAVHENNLYALTADNKILKFNDGSEKVDWYMETQKFDQVLFEKKSYKELMFNLELDYNSAITISLSKDDMPYAPVKTITDTQQKHFRVPINIRNCNTFSIKLEGSGRCLVKNVRRTFDIGGKINA